MDNINLNRQELENIYGKISPFEFKNKLIELANTSNRKSTRTLLDAGRGNPNWGAATPREAFFTFGHFAITESRFSWDNGDLTGIPKKTGIYNRFYKFINENLLNVLNKKINNFFDSITLEDLVNQYIESNSNILYYI